MRANEELTRAFLCVVPDGAAVEALRGWLGRLRAFGDYKWVAPEQVHITLKFLGDATADLLQKLDSNLSRSGAARSFPIRVSGAGAFPNLTRPKAIWLGVRSGADGLERLAKSAEQASRNAGFPQEKRKFKAHLTIARARAERAMPDELTHLLGEGPTLSWMCRGYVLMKSVLTPQGPVYTPLREYAID